MKYYWAKKEPYINVEEKLKALEYRIDAQDTNIKTSENKLTSLGKQFISLQTALSKTYLITTQENAEELSQILMNGVGYDGVYDPINAKEIINNNYVMIMPAII